MKGKLTLIFFKKLKNLSHCVCFGRGFTLVLVCKFLFYNLKISICNAAKHSAWIANSDYIIGDVFGNDTTGANDSVRADFDTGKNNTISAKPNIISY